MDRTEEVKKILEDCHDWTVAEEGMLWTINIDIAAKELLKLFSPPSEILRLQTESAARGEIIRRLTEACTGQKCKYVLEAKKQGMRELAEWTEQNIFNFAVDYKDGKDMMVLLSNPKLMAERWQSKLKELGL